MCVIRHFTVPKCAILEMFNRETQPSLLLDFFIKNLKIERQEKSLHFSLSSVQKTGSQVFIQIKDYDA